jgi:hypothetical protein
MHLAIDTEIPTNASGASNERFFVADTPDGTLHRLSHLEVLASESIHILREVAAECRLMIKINEAVARLRP